MEKKFFHDFEKSDLLIKDWLLANTLEKQPLR